MDLPSGRRYLKVSEYAERIAIDTPSIALAMAVELPMTATNKRIGIAYKRSLEWFSEISSYTTRPIDWENTLLFGVLPTLTDSFEDAKLNEYTSSLLLLGAKGIVLGGLYQGEEETARNKAIRRTKRVLAAQHQNAGDTCIIPLMVQGVKTPQQVCTIGRNNFTSLRLLIALQICRFSAPRSRASN